MNSKKVSALLISSILFTALIVYGLMKVYATTIEYQLVEVEMDLQDAEFRSESYREEVIELKEENYIMYDALRQIGATKEAELYSDDK